MAQFAPLAPTSALMLGDGRTTAPVVEGKPIEVAIGFYALDFARVTSRDESFDLTGGAPALNGGSARASAGSSTVSFASVSVTTTSVQPDPTTTATVNPTTPTLPPPISRTNYQLVWSDEFNGTSVDASKWNKVGPWGHSVASGWANFSYLTSNVSVANGLATITVHKSGSNWNGGILSTDTTKRFQYGFVEVRAKLPPKGPGFWPGIWLYGGTSSDELDMMEWLGRDVTTVYQTYHYGSGQQQGVSPKSSDWTTDYHLFQMKWEPSRITYYIDNVQTASWTQGVPARQMYLMFNFDVGDGVSPWGGYPDGSTPTTATFNVDYVRVYQHS